MIKNRPSCSNSVCVENSILLGTVRGDGQVKILTDRVVVDKDFIQIAKTGRKPERRFRFANSCIEKNCVQWENGQSGLNHKLVNAFLDEKESQLLLKNKVTRCPIRDTCRWYSQCGFDACRICPEIVTDLARNEKL
jgi:hypothetical protein